MKKYTILLVALALSFENIEAQDNHEQFATREIITDYNHEKGIFCKVFKECIGAGRANEGLRADWQQQLTIVQKEIGFKYIRFHGLLHDDMGVYKEDKDGNPGYNFQYIDKLFDYLLSINIKPFVELAFMPRDMASENTTVFWWNGNTSPPKSYEKWATLIKNLILHFQERYGFDEVKTWYFEVWNEPDIEPFYHKPIEEYFKLYSTTARTIKAISKEYKVGGPASAIPYSYEEKFLDYCVKNNVPVDFISTHSYGVKAGFFDANGNQGTILDSNKEAVRSRMIHSKELIKKSPLPNLELHFTEWSSSYTPTDYVHDTYLQAAFVLDKIKGAQEYVNSMSYWVFTDIFEENGPRFEPFHGGFGLINYQGIKKPAYRAYQFASMLGNRELVNTDSSSWVCKDNDGNVQALFWEFNPVEPKDSLNDQEFFKMEFIPKAAGSTKFFIKNIPNGTYQLQIYQTGYKVNDAYTTYLEMGAPSQLTVKQENTLKSICSGMPIQNEIISVSDSKFVKEFMMRDNDVYLVLLKKL